LTVDWKDNPRMSTGVAEKLAALVAKGLPPERLATEAFELGYSVGRSDVVAELAALTVHACNSVNS